MQLGETYSVTAFLEPMINTGLNIRLVSFADYEPYGSALPYRGFNEDKYRFGFNGQEKDNEIGEGIYTAEFWEYDSRIGRRWDIDPVVGATQSGYVCLNDNPLYYIDPNGLEPKSHRINLGLFTITKRLYNKGFQFQWNKSFSQGFMHFAGMMRNAFTGAHMSLSLVPMGHFDNWNTKTFSGTGTKDFDFEPDNYATYRYRGSYIRGFSTNPAVSFKIEDRQEQGIGRFIDKFTPFEMFSPGTDGSPDGFELSGASGAIPFINSYFQSKASGEYAANKLPEMLKDLGKAGINSLFTMPYHNHTTHFRVSTASSVQYEFTIRYRAWVRYSLNNRRNALLRFLYGTNN